MSESRKRRVFYIPAEAYVEGRGYRVSIVTEDEPGHAPTGTWPYTGAPGEQIPWFWGNTFEEAQKHAKEQNARLGHSERDVLDVITSSMRLG